MSCNIPSSTAAIVTVAPGRVLTPISRGVRGLISSGAVISTSILFAVRSTFMGIAPNALPAEPGSSSFTPLTSVAVTYALGLYFSLTGTSMVAVLPSSVCVSV
jgi:hypothetical protein